ncbi:MAG: alpha-glucosidase/alpha-galactosidase [Defluviitaleaceae bacterium]|nr:alpha-glucosidase/alpha-galactosidase [Defluviitaleaceae bacterium]
MPKITYLGAGSTVFARNILGDCMATDALGDCEIALYDIDGQRLKESEVIIRAICEGLGGRAKITGYLGVENRKNALRGADFVVNTIQVGLYDPCTIIDFEVPKKYGLRQTIADTLGIGGIMRGLRTIPVLADFARDMEEVCPDAWFLNYTNPMSILTGFMQRYTGVKTIGLCHSVQACTYHLFDWLGIKDKLDGRRELIAGINHMAWLLDVRDKNGVDLYPEIKRLAKEKFDEVFWDRVRLDYIDKLGYYCTESSEHNAEYNPWYIKSRYPELIEKFKIPLDEYPRRCVEQIENWAKEYAELSVSAKAAPHTRSGEYASYIMEALVTGVPYKIGGNVMNRALIENLPPDACVEVPCMVDNFGINPCAVGRLPVQLAAMNMTHINVHLCAIEAAVTQKKEHIYHAAMLDPLTAAELSLDDIHAMVDELIEAHGNWLPKYS